MITRTLPFVAAIALLPLAACNNNEPEVVSGQARDPLAEQIQNAAPVELPPAVAASVTFRCKDNSLIYVDFFQGNKLANLRTDKGGSPTQLKAEEAGKPYVGGDYTLTGDPKSVELKGPNGTRSCNA